MVRYFFNRQYTFFYCYIVMYDLGLFDIFNSYWHFSRNQKIQEQSKERT